MFVRSVTILSLRDCIARNGNAAFICFSGWGKDVIVAENGLFLNSLFGGLAGSEEDYKTVLFMYSRLR